MNHSFGLDFVILLIYIGLLIFAVYVKNFNIQEIYNHDSSLDVNLNSRYDDSLIKITILEPKKNSFTASSAVKFTLGGILLNQPIIKTFAVMPLLDGNDIIFPNGNNISFNHADKVHEAGHLDDSMIYTSIILFVQIELAFDLSEFGLTEGPHELTIKIIIGIKALR